MTVALSAMITDISLQFLYYFFCIVLATQISWFLGQSTLYIHNAQVLKTRSDCTCTRPVNVLVA